MQYRELQVALKNLRQAGYDVQVKLTSSYEILQAEYDRLTQPKTLEQPEVMAAEQFNTWVGLPTDNLAIAKQGSSVQPHEVQLTVVDESNEQVGIPVEQIKVAIAIVPTVEPKLEVKPKAMVVTTSSYWVDGSELSQHLESTQLQALRNAQDGIRWLKKWARNIQAFAEGFIEGGQVRQLERSPQVIAIDSYRYPQVA